MRLPSRPQRTYNGNIQTATEARARSSNGGSRGTTHSTATAQSTTRRRCNCNGAYLYIRLPLQARATIVLISCCSDKSQASFLSPAFRPHPWKGGCVRVCGFSAGEGGMSEAAETRAYRMIAQRNLSLRTSPPTPGNGKQDDTLDTFVAPTGPRETPQKTTRRRTLEQHTRPPVQIDVHTNSAYPTNTNLFFFFSRMRVSPGVETGIHLLFPSVVFYYLLQLVKVLTTHVTST